LPKKQIRYTITWSI